MRTYELEKIMLQNLLNDRCGNPDDYATPKAFRKVCQQRYRARKAIKARGLFPTLNWDSAGLVKRIDWDTLTYTVGQNKNEEITHLLRQLINPYAKWVN